MMNVWWIISLLLARNKIKVGSKITLTNDNGEKKFKVVGLINDPRYFSTIEQGGQILSVMELMRLLLKF